jgi:hypothetical protein
MTEFELILADALREEAKEISMTTDQQRAAEELRTRLDHSDRSRRGWYIGTAAAVVAIGLLVAALVFRPGGDADSGQVVNDPSSSPSSGPAPIPYTLYWLTPPLSVELPPWTEEVTADHAGLSVAFAEDDCAGLNGASPCPDDADLRLRLLQLSYFFVPGDTQVTSQPSYADYVAHLDALEPEGIATISDRSEIQVGGRPATVMSLSVLLDAPGAVACAKSYDPAEDCAPLIAGRAARFAVVDQGADNPPTVFYLSLNGDATDRTDRFAEFDAMLESATFG